VQEAGCGKHDRMCVSLLETSPIASRHLDQVMQRGLRRRGVRADGGGCGAVGMPTGVESTGVPRDRLGARAQAPTAVIWPENGGMADACRGMPRGLGCMVQTRGWHRTTAVSWAGPAKMPGRVDAHVKLETSISKQANQPANEPQVNPTYVCSR
jgi:hypothetical protein